MNYKIIKSKLFYLPNKLWNLPINDKKNNFNYKILNINFAFSRYKNIEKMIELMNKLVKINNLWTLTIKGSINNEENQCYYHELCELINTYKLNNNVFLINNKTDINNINIMDDIQYLYDTHDIYINTSKKEAFGYSIAESIMNGLYPFILDWEEGNSKNIWGECVYDNIELLCENLIRIEKLSYNSRIENINNIRNKLMLTNLSSLPEQLILNIINKYNILIFCYNNHIFEFNPRGGEISTLFIAEYLSKYYNIYILTFRKEYKSYFSYIKNNLNVLNYPYISEENVKNVLNNVIQEKNINIGITWSYPAINYLSNACIKNDINYIIFVRWFAEFREKRPIGNLLLNKHENLETINKNKNIFQKAYSIFTNNNWSKQLIYNYYGYNLDVNVTYVPIEKKNILQNINPIYILLVTPDKNLGEYELISNLSDLMPNEIFLLINVEINSKCRNIKKHNVIIHDYVKNIDEIYSKTKILLYSAYNDDVCGTSRVAIEAMRFCIPSICNKKCGLDEIIPFTVSENAGFNEWVEQINYINNNYKTCQKICENIYNSYDKKMDLSILLNKINNLFKDIDNKNINYNKDKKVINNIFNLQLLSCTQMIKYENNKDIMFNCSYSNLYNVTEKKNEYNSIYNDERFIRTATNSYNIYKYICQKKSNLENYFKLLYKSSIKKNRKYLIMISGFSKKEGTTFYISSNKLNNIYNDIHELKNHLTTITCYIDSINDSDIIYGLENYKNIENEIYILRIGCEDITDIYENVKNQCIVNDNNKNYDFGVVIAIHYRFEILELVINNILKSNIKICIILIYSDNENLLFCQKMKNKYNNIFYLFSDNHNIGMKFHLGVLYSEVLNCKYIMICGSDDVILPRYIEDNYLKMETEQIDFIGTINWKIYDCSNNELFDVEYTNNNSNYPLGCGRIISKKILEYYNYTIFDLHRKNLLDDHIYIYLKNNSTLFKTYLIKNCSDIISYKGDWEQMNDINKIKLAVENKKNYNFNMKKIDSFEIINKISNINI